MQIIKAGCWLLYKKKQVTHAVGKHAKLLNSKKTTITGRRLVGAFPFARLNALGLTA